MNINRIAATKLRDSGYSYRMIHNQLGVPMATLSGWFRERPYTPNAEALHRIQSGRYAYGIRKRDERICEIAELLQLGKDEVGDISRRDLWMVGIGLWIGEGSKTIEQIRLANSDPDVVRLWVGWLKEICGLRDENIFMTLHIYPETDEEVCLKYWRNIIGIPNLRCGKTQVDRRIGKAISHNGKLPYGTVRISVRSEGDTAKGVRLYRRLKGWVSAILNI
ncbi:hypothetical protein IPL68_01575 [Candidatus Saccharibacteria bacterium]|nr:MAG: hypothetical protein IPL68_01575 [Candidatus Saccharibacteria bacterium]